MQNPYAMERFVHEHNAHARVMAELQGLRRQALAARRQAMLNGWLARLGELFTRSAESGSRRMSISRSGPDIPLAEARR